MIQLIELLQNQLLVGQRGFNESFDIIEILCGLRQRLDGFTICQERLFIGFIAQRCADSANRLAGGLNGRNSQPKFVLQEFLFSRQASLRFGRRPRWWLVCSRSIIGFSSVAGFSGLIITRLLKRIDNGSKQLSQFGGPLLVRVRCVGQKLLI